MGWELGNLTSLAALLFCLCAAGAAQGGDPASTGEPAPAEHARSEALSEEDLQLLRDLELLEELDLLRNWDPAEDLPIPVGEEPP